MHLTQLVKLLQQRWDTVPLLRIWGGSFWEPFRHLAQSLVQANCFSKDRFRISPHL